jgi:hypothetical protein
VGAHTTCRSSTTSAKVFSRSRKRFASSTAAAISADSMAWGLSNQSSPMPSGAEGDGKVPTWFWIHR